VDPITASYPELTPYQFASNRPIDGIDLDGLEYKTYRVTINHDKTQITVSVAKDFRNQKDFNYKKYSQSFGDKGRGIEFIYEYLNEAGEIIESESVMEFGQDGVNTRIGRHGHFMGEGSITYLGPEFESGYNFSMTPIDGVDAAAKGHDIRDGEQRNGSGWLEDVGLLASDRTLLKEFKDYTKNHKNGEIDIYTGRKASREAKRAAKSGALLFGMVVSYKEWKVGEEAKGRVVTIDDYKKGGALKRLVTRMALKMASK